MTTMFFLIGAVCFVVFIFRYIRESRERKPMLINMLFIMAALLLLFIGTLQLQRTNTDEGNKKDAIITENIEKIEALSDQKAEIESKMEETVRTLKEDMAKLEESKTADVESAIKKAKEEMDKQYQANVKVAVDEAVVFVNINLSQRDHFKSEPLHSVLFPYLGKDWEFRGVCPQGQTSLNSSRAHATGRFLPFVSYFV